LRPIGARRTGSQSAHSLQRSGSSTTSTPTIKHRFLMQRAGYDEKPVWPSEEARATVRFYLAHDVREAAFDEEWRLFYQRGFSAQTFSTTKSEVEIRIPPHCLQRRRQRRPIRRWNSRCSPMPASSRSGPPLPRRCASEYRCSGALRGSGRRSKDTPNVVEVARSRVRRVR